MNSENSNIQATTSTDTNKSLKISVQLDTTNYSVWRYSMIPMLVDEKLAEIETNEDTQLPETVKVKDSTRALRALQINMSVDMIAKVIHLKTPQEIWDYFHGMYSGTSHNRKIVGILNLCNFRTSNEDIRSNVGTLRQILNETIIASNSISIDFEELAVYMLLNSLPTQYSSTRSHISRSNIKTLTEAEAELVKEEELLGPITSEGGFAGFTKKRFKRKFSPGTKLCTQHQWKADECKFCNPNLDPINILKNSVCSDCSEKGHKSMASKRCKLYGSKNSANTLFETSDELEPFKKAHFAGVAHNNNRILKIRKSVYKRRRDLPADDLRLVIDSGATSSVFRNKDQILNYLPSISSMHTANAGQMICTGRGTFPITRNINVNDVLICPTAAVNLLSVAQLTELGLKVSFDNAKCVISRNNEVLLTGVKRNGLYIYTPTKYASAFLATNKPKTRIELFHFRMGHINFADLRRLTSMSDGVILDSSPENGPCESCITAKSHRKHFQSSTSQAKRFGELTHTDVCYIGVPTIIGNYTMFLLFVDDSTRFTTCYLLKNKSDTVTVLKSYDARVANITGKHCQIIRSDNGTEFFNRSVKEYCSDRGIIQQSSTPYTPQSNARAERPNRTILEGASAMLHHMNLPHNYWGWAVLTFVYLKNRSPHSALRKVTPFEARYQELPDLSHIRVFGSRCFVHIPKENAAKGRAPN